MRKEPSLAVLIVVVFITMTLAPSATEHFGGPFSINPNSGILKSESAIEGTHVDCGFSTSPNPIEFYLINSESWDKIGKPNITLCEYYVTGKSATYSFDIERNSTWLIFFFSNSELSQEVDYQWDVSSAEQQGARLLELGILGLVAVITGAYFLSKYLNKR